VPTCPISWPQAWRVITSRYPPINLYERLTANTAVWDALIALEELPDPSPDRLAQPYTRRSLRHKQLALDRVGSPRRSR
jgi:hypothetical protein